MLKNHLTKLNTHFYINFFKKASPSKTEIKGQSLCLVEIFQKFQPARMGGEISHSIKLKEAGIFFSNF